MKPEDALKQAEHYLRSLKEMKTKHVAVGVLESEATKRVYGNDTTVGQVAAIHEYGLGNSPQRSFLKLPQELKQKEISNFINKQMEKVFDGMSVSQGLGLIGQYNLNLIQDAFASGGFGKWDGLDPYTIQRKGSSGVLIDTGILKNSITYEVR